MSGQLQNPLPHWGRGGYLERTRRRFTPMLILLLIALTLAGCGKKGAPQPPPDEPNVYPRTYPSA